VRIACVGGGPAGLYFSILMKLWDPASDVVVFERGKEGVTHGWGVTMEQEFLARLAQLDPESAEEIEWRSTRWQDQVVCFGGGRSAVREEGDARAIGRQRFVDIIATRARQLGVEIRYEHAVSGESELSGADLILAADGVDSRLRAGRPEFGSTVTEARNKHIWLGTGLVFDSFNFFFERTEAGWIWAYAYQHEPRASTFIVECEPSTWSGLGLDSCSPTRALGLLEEVFAAHLDGHRLWSQFPDGTDASWRNFRTVSNERWHSGKVVLAGDSAHTAHFSAGLGTTLALEDVIALAAQLRRTGYRPGSGPADLATAFTAYQRQRRAELRSHAARARRGALWFENVPRYADLTPRQFAALLHARHAPLLQKLPSRLSGRLLDIRQRAGLAGQPRSLAG
jgi:2-polyprenyl-6-methoxyphenol hydroxylase-like FAD-dependent oxidoreductase